MRLETTGRGLDRNPDSKELAEKTDNHGGRSGAERLFPLPEGRFLFLKAAGCGLRPQYGGRQTARRPRAVKAK